MKINIHRLSVVNQCNIYNNTKSVHYIWSGGSFVLKLKSIQD